MQVLGIIIIIINNKVIKGFEKYNWTGEFSFPKVWRSKVGDFSSETFIIVVWLGPILGQSVIYSNVMVPI